MSEQTKVRAKGTPKTEAIIGAASNKIVTATKALNDAVATAVKLTETLDENALKISEQEEKLTNLQTDYANKRTQHKIDLDLAYKADQQVFAEKYLTDKNLVAVSKEDYQDLQTELQVLKTEFDQKVRAEVGKAEGMANARAESANKLANAEYRAKEAENLAKINSLEQQLKFANEQAASWQKQLESERQASIERGKSQTATVNVTPGGGR